MLRIKFENSIIGFYLLLGSLWILFSDNLLNILIQDKAMLTHFQTYKGWFFVVVTAGIFYMILKKHLIKLREAERKAKESDMLKTAFLQNISHEVRTPMNSIIGFSELVRDERVSDEKRAEYLRIINMSSMQLLNVVNSILDISLIETGNLRVSEKKVQLNEVLDEVHSYVSPLIKEDVSFTVRKGLPDYEATIMTDEQKLKKVIINIVSNAVKFTDKGQISIGYTCDGQMLEFFAEDTGIGIPEDFLRNIFDGFRKAENGGNKFYEGLGLGLSISKGYLEILGGKLWVTSEKGKGSKFYFTIPYKPVSVPSEQLV